MAKLQVRTWAETYGIVKGDGTFGDNRPLQPAEAAAAFTAPNFLPITVLECGPVYWYEGFANNNAKVDWFWNMSAGTYGDVFRINISIKDTLKLYRHPSQRCVKVFRTFTESATAKVPPISPAGFTSYLASGSPTRAQNSAILTNYWTRFKAEGIAPAFVLDDYEGFGAVDGPNLFSGAGWNAAAVTAALADPANKAFLPSILHDKPGSAVYTRNSPEFHAVNRYFKKRGNEDVAASDLATLAAEFGGSWSDVATAELSIPYHWPLSTQSYTDYFGQTVDADLTTPRVSRYASEYTMYSLYNGQPYLRPPAAFAPTPAVTTTKAAEWNELIYHLNAYRASARDGFEIFPQVGYVRRTGNAGIDDLKTKILNALVAHLVATGRMRRMLWFAPNIQRRVNAMDAANIPGNDGQPGQFTPQNTFASGIVGESSGVGPPPPGVQGWGPTPDQVVAFAQWCESLDIPATPLSAGQLPPIPYDADVITTGQTVTRYSDFVTTIGSASWPTSTFPRRRKKLIGRVIS